MAKDSKGAKLQKELSYKKSNGFEMAGEKGKKEIFAYAKEYMAFLDGAKTERLAAELALSKAKKAGFLALSDYKSLKTGDKFYVFHKHKAVIMGRIGEEPLSSGLNIIAAHIDSPRLDVKPNPLYEDESLAMFKTHYYGGIKKYQWTALPLSLIGVIVKKDGERIEINIGEKEDDPVFCISDLLPHLASEQMAKKMTDAIPGEGLNVLLGSLPYDEKELSEKVKLTILQLLNEKYGLTEEDFLSSELSLVPNLKARDVGLDRSMVGGYGQDDRVCAYTGLTALLEADAPKRTAILVLADKEEIGSMGTTGMQSRFFENVVDELCDFDQSKKRIVLSNSVCLSADVNAAADPNYPEVTEKRNAAHLGFGVALAKYTGSRGKSGSSDASAELVAKVRSLFSKNEIPFQMGELGKVDQGGGGTVAQFLANLDIDTIDCGVALLSMHSPFEVASKADVYYAHKAYAAFLNQFI